MTFNYPMFLGILLVSALLAAPQSRAQATAQNSTTKSAGTAEADTQKKNTQAYIDLMRSKRSAR